MRNLGLALVILLFSLQPQKVLAIADKMLKCGRFQPLNALEESCLWVDTKSLRIAPSGKRSIEAGIFSKGASSGARIDAQMDCHNGTVLLWNESVAHPPRTNTFLEDLYKYVCNYKKPSVHRK